MVSRIVSFSAKYSDVEAFKRAYERYRRVAPVKDRIRKSKMFQQKLRDLTSELNTYVERATMLEVKHNEPHLVDFVSIEEVK